MLASHPDRKDKGPAQFLSKEWIGLYALVLALAPSWIPYTVDMWGSGHYQYFPVLIGVVGYLLYGRLDLLQSYATKPARWLTVLGYLGIALLAVSAHLLYSGFLGIVATVLAAWVVVYAQFWVWRVEDSGVCFGAPCLRHSASPESRRCACREDAILGESDCGSIA